MFPMPITTLICIRYGKREAETAVTVVSHHEVLTVDMIGRYNSLKAQATVAPFFCYPSGKHAYRPSNGYPGSLKLRNGYLVIFKYRGRVVGKQSRSGKINVSERYDQVEVTGFRRPSGGRD